MSSASIEEWPLLSPQPANSQALHFNELSQGPLKVHCNERMELNAATQVTVFPYNKKLPWVKGHKSFPLHCKWEFKLKNKRKEIKRDVI